MLGRAFEPGGCWVKTSLMPLVLMLEIRRKPAVLGCVDDVVERFQKRWSWRASLAVVSVCVSVGPLPRCCKLAVLASWVSGLMDVSRGGYYPQAQTSVGFFTFLSPEIQILSAFIIYERVA